MRLLSAIALFLVLAACNPPAPAFRSTPLSAVDWGRDFELTAHTGQRLRSADYRGKVQVLFFGYTHCPDICAPTLSKLAQVSRSLGPASDRLQVFFISVDPAHDSPSQLKKFLAGFDPGFIGLTGTAAQLQAVASDYKVFFNQEPGGRVSHTGMVFVKDISGRLRLLMKESAGIDDMRHDLLLLLAEK